MQLRGGLELAVDVAEQEEVPDCEHRGIDVAATHDERERPRHRHDEQLLSSVTRGALVARSVFQTESSSKGLMLQTALVTQTALVHAQEYEECI